VAATGMLLFWGWFLLVPAGVFAVVLVVRLLLLSRSRPRTVWEPEDNSFLDARSNEVHQFTSALHTTPSKYLSLVVPAYCEEHRLPVMLDETLLYLKERQKRELQFTWEIIIVDDGSPDRTSAVALQYVKAEGTDQIRVLRLSKNSGKGGALRRGMVFARGQFALMVDADGATRISDVEALEKGLKLAQRTGHGVAVGSRAHLISTDVVVKRTALRNFLMRSFHLACELLCVRGIRDTQCGFKLFCRDTALALFMNLHVNRWAFDVELLFLAQQIGIPVVEIPVNWQEIAGSKLDPFYASLQIGRDMLRIRLNYLIGWWRIEWTDYRAPR